ncbi:bifunctional 2-polyprenyl-6-hydroxyphenol methylase/3-demethylubiquinol 3-O-methyltransferase UbiG [Aureispira sp. CCB-QB1]|uniref:class I SAM-dependent methyltransferase n=1 Tax=Aureispira sp. CCB-QB1 TaxID=1313421 RepID=UPI0006986B51|nr:class I SAM-dependent methyltransferase [Aureispira sp. CCB-QB1]
MYSSENFWNRVSSHSSDKIGKIGLQIIHRTTSYLNKSDTVLDFGCGSGLISIELAKAAQDIVAIDTSEKMIKIAQDKSNNIPQKISFLYTDLFDQRFKNNSFDIILAFNVLHYVPDTKKTLKKIYTLLKPNGIFISSTACLGEKRSLPRIFMTVLLKLGIMPTTNFYTKIKLQQSIQQSGFFIKEQRELSNLPELFLVAQKH